MILSLREMEVQPDTVVTEEEIQRRFTELSPGVRARARHIFLATAQGASPVQRDSVRALAASLRDRVVRGESFEQLARQFSNDQASSAEGGDLGWIGRNELFGALDSAIFSLQPGEVSDVVESVYGLHVLRLEEMQTPTLEEVRPDVRAFIQQQRVDAAESVLIARVEEGADLDVQAGAVELVRRAAEAPGMQLSRRARNRALVTFRGGALEMNDVLAFMQSRNSQFRIELYNATDQAIQENLLLALAQRKLLAAEAEARGVEVSAAEREEVEQELRSRLVEAAGQLGLTNLPAGSDAGARSAREQHVRNLLREMLRGNRDVTPLGSFSFVLRERYGGHVSLPAVQLVVERIQSLRGPGTQAPPPPDPTLLPGTSPLPPLDGPGVDMSPLGGAPAPPEQQP
jgi:parvulin-like peptidyl-prolyl isomerase